MMHPCIIIHLSICTEVCLFCIQAFLRKITVISSVVISETATFFGILMVSFSSFFSIKIHFTSSHFNRRNQGTSVFKGHAAFVPV